MAHIVMILLAFLVLAPTAMAEDVNSGFGDALFSQSAPAALSDTDEPGMDHMAATLSDMAPAAGGDDDEFTPVDEPPFAAGIVEQPPLIAPARNGLMPAE